MVLNSGLVEQIQNLIRHCTGKTISMSGRPQFINGAVHVIIAWQPSVEKIQRIALDTIELSTVECGQLYRYPWISLTEYDRHLSLTELHKWLDKGWIFQDVYDRWKAVIESGNIEEIEKLGSEMHDQGRIFWSLDEIRQGSKKVGSTNIDLQTRLQTGRCILNFLVSHDDVSIILRLEIRSHRSNSSSNSFGSFGSFASLGSQ